MSRGYAVVRRLDEDKGPKGYSGVVLQLHGDARSAIDAALTHRTFRSPEQTVDAIRLPTKVRPGQRLYYGKHFILVETLWAKAERMLAALRAEQPDEPGDDICATCGEQGHPCLCESRAATAGADRTEAWAQTDAREAGRRDDGMPL